MAIDKFSLVAPAATVTVSGEGVVQSRVISLAAAHCAVPLSVKGIVTAPSEAPLSAKTKVALPPFSATLPPPEML